MSKHPSVRARRLAPLALAGLALAAPAAAATRACAPAGAIVLRASGAVRIYSQGTALYGCLGARRTRLGSLRGTLPAPAARVDRYVLAGHYAGVDTVQMGVDTFASTVALVDLRSGATLARTPAAAPLPRPESFVTVTQMAVNRNGVLAWVSRAGAVSIPQPTYQLHVLEHGRDYVDSDGTLPIVGLRLTASIVGWRDDHAGPVHQLPLAA
jgi:hypothetical protein